MKLSAKCPLIPGCCECKSFALSAIIPCVCVVNLQACGPAFEDAATNPITLSEREGERGKREKDSGAEREGERDGRALTCSWWWKTLPWFLLNPLRKMHSHILTVGRHNRKKKINKSELLKVFPQMLMLQCVSVFVVWFQQILGY